MFNDEWERRFEELEDALFECHERGGDIEREVPEEWAEYKEMELVYQTEFF